jgi:putative transcriptional regulator
MNVRHHISDELLGSYAAGTLSEGWSLAVATHLALCPECRRKVAAAEAVGGALLADSPMEDVGAAALEDVFARIDRAGAEPARPLAPPAGEAELLFPEPLRSYLGGGRDLNWRRLGTARQIRIPTGDRSTTCRLLKIPGGQPMPVHGHRGLELTLVLAGSFSDDHGTFARGDIEEADEGVEHQPVASPGEECICLAVTDAPLRFRGIAALLQPFLRI